MKRITEYIPVNIKSIMDLIYGVPPEDDYSSFVRSRELRRKNSHHLMKCEQSDYSSFGNVMKLTNDFENEDSNDKVKVKKL